MQLAQATIHAASLRGFTITLLAILCLFALHGLDIWLYAFLYLALGAVDGLREGVYFSTITYGAIGYSDEAMAEEWRSVSAIDGINGIILIGWSTAFFITVVARLRRIRRGGSVSAARSSTLPQQGFTSISELAQFKDCAPNGRPSSAFRRETENVDVCSDDRQAAGNDALRG